MYRSLRGFIDPDDMPHDDEALRSKNLEILFKIHRRTVSKVQDDVSKRWDGIFLAIQDSIPMFDDDVISVLCAFCALVDDVFQIGTLRYGQICLRWSNVCLHNDPYNSLWDTYDRDKGQLFEIFYFRDGGEIKICLEMCAGSECAELIQCMLGRFGHSDASRDRWVLGTTHARTPCTKFSLWQHADLIWTVLEFNSLNQRRCHSIYIGRTLGIADDDKPHCGSLQ